MRKLLQNPSIYSFLQGLIASRENGKYFVENFIKPFDGMKVLDIGCGPAFLLDSFHHNIFYTGVDGNKKYINFAKKKYPHQTFIHTYITSATTPSFLDKYDVVVASGILHHLDNYESENLLKCAYNHLTENGKLITLDGVYLKKQNIIARLLLNLDRGKYVRYEKGYNELAEKIFPQVEGGLIKLKIRIPYDHYIMVCSK